MDFNETNSLSFDGIDINALVHWVRQVDFFAPVKTWNSICQRNLLWKDDFRIFVELRTTQMTARRFLNLTDAFRNFKDSETSWKWGLDEWHALERIRWIGYESHECTSRCYSKRKTFSKREREKNMRRKESCLLLCGIFVVKLDFFTRCERYERKLHA